MRSTSLDCCTAMISVGDSPELSARYDRQRQEQAERTAPEYARRAAYALAVRQLASLTDAQLTLAVHRAERACLVTQEELDRAYGR